MMDDLKDFVKQGLRRHALNENLAEGKSDTKSWWERLPGKRRKKVVSVLGLSKGKDKIPFEKMDGGEQSEIEAYFTKHQGRVEGFDFGGEPLCESRPKLTPEQVKEVEKELTSNGVPVRFFIGGSAIDILTGKPSPKGQNVMYQPVYWNFPRETSRKIAKWLGATPKFSG